MEPRAITQFDVLGRRWSAAGASSPTSGPCRHYASGWRPLKRALPLVGRGGLMARAFVAAGLLSLVAFGAAAQEAGQPSGDDSITGCRFEGKLKMKRQKQVLAPPEPSEGNAGVYFLAGKKGRGFTSFTASLGIHFTVALNGRLVAHVAPGNYFYFETSPGLVRVCEKAGWGNPTLLYLTAEAGKRYYLTLLAGEIREMTEDEGRKRIKKYNYVTFEPEP